METVSEGYDWSNSVFHDESTKYLKGIIYFNLGDYQSRKIIMNSNYESAGTPNNRIHKDVCSAAAPNTPVMQSVMQFKLGCDMGPCIFCFKSYPEVSFSKEHLIPDSLGGMLILNDYVCSACNSKFGSEFDHEILKNPEILSALENLELLSPCDKKKFINHNYKVKLHSADVELRARATKEGFTLHPQSLPNGSMIYNEKDYEGPLLKSLYRNQHLNKSGLTLEQIKFEHSKLTKLYKQASVGDKVESQSLGVVLVKRSDAFSINFEPKGSCDVSRLIAKIAYEFGFIVGHRDFLSSENVAKPLHNFIETGQPQQGLHVYRTIIESQNYALSHYISFQCYDDHTRIVVGFFGRIAYTLIAPHFENKILNIVSKTYGYPEVVGVEYQQDMAKDSVGFWALLQGEKIKYIGP